MALGLTITNKMARLWPGGLAAFAIHEYTSLLGLAFALFHGVVLLGDHYINYNLAQILVPFASRNYLPFWVGLGQVGFYAWGIITFTFYIRRWIGQKTWRFIHFGSYIMFFMALLHVLTAGGDSGALWAQWFYWLTGGSLIFLFIYRVLFSLGGRSVPETGMVAQQSSPEMQR